MPGVGIIRNEGIIRGRVLYEKMRYMFFLLYALCWMVFCWFLFCSTIKPVLSTFRVENVQVEEAIGKIVSILSFITQEYVRNTTFCKQTCIGRWFKKRAFPMNVFLLYVTLVSAFLLYSFFGEFISAVCFIGEIFSAVCFSSEHF